MGTPTMTPRTEPAGSRLIDGWKSTIAFSVDPSVYVWEIECTPFGLEGGEKHKITTMHNDVYEQYAPHPLIELSDGEMLVAYDPAHLSRLLGMIDSQGSVTYHYPNHGADSAFGYLRSFKRNSLKIGEMPTAVCVIVHTNRDPSDGSEAGPVYTASGGTP